MYFHRCLCLASVNFHRIWTPIRRKCNPDKSTTTKRAISQIRDTHSGLVLSVPNWIKLSQIKSVAGFTLSAALQSPHQQHHKTKKESYLGWATWEVRWHNSTTLGPLRVPSIICHITQSRRLGPNAIKHNGILSSVKFTELIAGCQAPESNI